MFSAYLVSAATETEKVNLAYNWLATKVATWPSGDDGAFALLALSYDSVQAAKGRAALMAASKNNGECWPSASCNVKSTSLAILALNSIGENTEDAERWLLSKEKPYIVSGAEWHLQIDNAEAGTMSCTIRYDTFSYQRNLSADKKFKENAGNCLEVSIYSYKIKDTTVSGSRCLDKTYSIKCDATFYVSMIYRNTKNNIIYVPGGTKTGSAGTDVQANIETVCLADGTTCSELLYESNAWAVYALTLKGKDVSKLIPYLIGLADANDKVIPDAFLYLITADSNYADKLLNLQDQRGGYWLRGTNKIYDTAIAILALKDYNPDAKKKAQDNILTSQSADGSWGSIKDTSLVLYAFWPKAGVAGLPENDCTQRGYTCRNSCLTFEEENEDYKYACFEGKCCAAKAAEKTCLSEGYDCCDKCSSGHQATYDDSCPGQLCCSQCLTEESCYDLGGKICSYDEECSITPKRTSEGEDCCLGTCEIPTPSEQTCAEMNGELCEKGKCTGTFQYASDGRCCVGGECKKPSYWWIIILSIAIIAAVLFFLQKKGILKFKFGKKKPAPPAPPYGIPQAMARPVPAMPAAGARPLIKPLQPWQPPQQVKFIPKTQAQPAQPQKSKTETEEELEKTIKKLKEM